MGEKRAKEIVQIDAHSRHSKYYLLYIVCILYRIETKWQNKQKYIIDHAYKNTYSRHMFESHGSDQFDRLVDI